MDIRRIGTNNQINIQKIKEKKAEENKKEINEKKYSSVNISGESKQYIELAKQLPDTREALVEKLKKAIENGLYEIDANKIASKMLGGI